MRTSALMAVSLLVVTITPLVLAEDFNPSAGNYWTYRVDGFTFTTKYFAYKAQVNGYSVLRLLNLQDPYGGGSYTGYVPGTGLCEIGADVHDAFTEEYEGIAINYPPIPVNGGICYGDPVGTKREWVGYSMIDGEDYVEMYEKDAWEVLGYEDVAVPFGTFVNAMKLVCKNYYTTVFYVNGQPVPDDWWEFDSSCSEYIWWSPCVGMIKSVDYEGFDTFELVNCKVNCPIVFDPTPAEVSLTLNGSKLPSSILCGSRVAFPVTAEITNIDSKACPSGTAVALSFYLQNTGTSEKILIGELGSCSISNLAAGKIKKYMAKIMLPETLAVGQYYCVAEMGDKSAVLGDYVLTVAEAFVELKMEGAISTLPSAVIAGTTVKADVQLAVFNRGNIPAPADATARIDVMAHSAVDENVVIPLAGVDLAVGNLAPSKSKKVKLPIAFGAGIPEGEYIVRLYLNGKEQVVTLNAQKPIKVAAPYIELAIAQLQTNLPVSVIAGTDVTATIQVSIINRGNISTSKTETAEIVIVARPLGGGNDIVLNSVICAAGNLKPDKAKNVKLPVCFPATLPEGVYNVVILVDGKEQVVIESPIQVAEPSIELAGSLIGSISPTIVVFGSSSQAAFSLRIENKGTTPTSKSQTIGVAVYGRQQASEPLVLMGEVLGQTVGNLASGQSVQKSFAIPIANSGNLQSGTYALFARIDSRDDIKEENENDNWIILGQASVQVVGGLMDVMFSSGQSLLYSTIVKGDYFWESGRGTVSSGSGGYFTLEDGSWWAYEGEDWEQRADGTYLSYYEWENSNYEYCYFHFDSLVLPSNFQLMQKYSHTSAATGYHRLYGAGFYFDGTAQTTCEIPGFETVNVGGVSYDALKIIFSLTINATGELDQTPYGGKFFNTASYLKKEITYWAVPGTGVVKSNTNNYYKISLLGKGGASETFKGTESRELIPTR